MRWLIMMLTVVNISGCATSSMGGKIPDWPSLVVTEKFLTSEELHSVCSKYVSPGKTVHACTVWNFDTGKVTSYYPVNPPQWLLDHERAHQQGYDHWGSTQMQDHWNRWKADHAPSN